MTRRLSFLAGLLIGLPFTASALSSEATIYGTLLPFADNARTSGATAAGLSPANGGASLVPATAYTATSLPNRNRVTSGTSNLGLRGSLEVNEYLTVFAQIESAISPDGDAPNALAGRNTAVGLRGPWGAVFYGNWDTPYKYPLLFVGPLRGLSPFDNAITGNPGFNVPGTTTQTGRANARADAAFSRRQGNTIQYWTPTLYGFSGRVAYSTNEGKTVATTTAPSISPELWSALASYENGPVGIRYGFERHGDYFGLAQLGGAAPVTVTNRSSRDFGHEVVAWYSLAATGTRVSAIFERLLYDTDDTVVGDVKHYDRDAFYVLLQQRYGRNQLWAALGRASDGVSARVGGGAASSKGLGATEWSVGYSFSPVKTVDLFACYYQMDNGRSASYAVFPSPGLVAPGATTRGFGVGVLYSFDAGWHGSL